MVFRTTSASCPDLVTALTRCGGTFIGAQAACLVYLAVGGRRIPTCCPARSSPAALRPTGRAVQHSRCARVSQLRNACYPRFRTAELPLRNILAISFGDWFGLVLRKYRLVIPRVSRVDVELLTCDASIGALIMGTGFWGPE